MNFNKLNHPAISLSLSTEHINQFFENALQWAFSFSSFAYLHSNSAYNKTCLPIQFDRLIAIDSTAIFKIAANENAHLPHLHQFIENHYPTNIFGYLGYDLKNEIENLQSNNRDEIGLDTCFLFSPVYLIIQNGNNLQIISSNKTINPKELFNLLDKYLPTSAVKNYTAINNWQIESRTSKMAYLQAFEKIQQLIKEGVFYEINYCQEFYCKNVQLDIYKTFNVLNNSAKAPMTALLKNNDQYIISASPERFLQKKEGALYAQPIKGTAPRGATSQADEHLKAELVGSIKERAENTMIVDLTRNDMSRCCQVGSIEVLELCKLYSFSTVHQLISTIKGRLKNNISFIDILKYTFPMGSMTGAPKISAMQWIETLELARRGVFSGAIGYLSSDANFDFNVAIRTILYNEKQNTISFQTGGAITIDSIADNEYNECLLKAHALIKAITAAG